MGFEEIAKLCANMNLMEKERPVLRLKEGLKSVGMQMLALILVGKIHRVSLLCMTKEIRHFLGSMVGMVKEVDVGVSGECSRDFLRVRVVIDIAKPLRRCVRVDVMGDGEKTMMILHYERLPNHCFRCGRLGHSSGECLESPIMANSTGLEELPFGAWLCTSVPDKQWW
ncbi:hypothetical protein Q3G72_010611 [Acer saccharum]|nr:hypothetical protein Q3G72_010611 [Acer saccharum]